MSAALRSLVARRVAAASQRHSVRRSHGATGGSQHSAEFCKHSPRVPRTARRGPSATRAGSAPHPTSAGMPPKAAGGGKKSAAAKQVTNKRRRGLEDPDIERVSKKQGKRDDKVLVGSGRYFRVYRTQHRMPHRMRARCFRVYQKAPGFRPGPHVIGARGGGGGGGGGAEGGFTPGRRRCKCVG